MLPHTNYIQIIKLQRSTSIKFIFILFWMQSGSDHHSFSIKRPFSVNPWHCFPQRRWERTQNLEKQQQANQLKIGNRGHLLNLIVQNFWPQQPIKQVFCHYIISSNINRTECLLASFLNHYEIDQNKLTTIHCSYLFVTLNTSQIK